MGRLNKFSVCLLFCALSFIVGCSTEIDADGYRAGAIEVQLEQVVSDEMYPTAGDEVDWKMVFIPSPGDIIVNTFWDSPTEVFNVSVGIYDRFGIPIKVEKRSTGDSRLSVRAFSPESGLHYVKVSAASGRSIYSINIQFEYNEDGIPVPDSAPIFDTYLDFDSEVEMAASGGNSKGGGGGAPAGGGGGGGAPAGGGGGGGGAPAGGGGAPAGGGADAPAGGGGDGMVLLPKTVSGGIVSSNAQSTTVVVPSGGGGGGGGGGGRVSPANVRTINQKTNEVTTEKSAVKPICSDIKGNFKSINADVLSVTSKKKGAQIKLSVGEKDGVNNGAVGDIYVDGKILEGGRFKVTKILQTSCIAETNADAADVKRASKFVVKSPQ